MVADVIGSHLTDEEPEARFQMLSPACREGRGQDLNRASILHSVLSLSLLDTIVFTRPVLPRIFTKNVICLGSVPERFFTVYTLQHTSAQIPSGERILCNPVQINVIHTQCVCFLPDRPWIWNIPYTKAPDTHGNMWVPS